MAYEEGDIKIFNPNKEISKEVVLEVLIRHRDAFKQARTGELGGLQVEKIKDNDRKLNQVRALNLIISSQREMINISRPVIYHSALTKFNKKHKNEKEILVKFEDEENDYTNIISWKNFLIEVEQAILTAERTSSLEDDFMITKVDSQGETINELTSNFFEMLEDLEDAYEQIYLLMLTNKIVSAGIEEDEEMTYKEKEAEAIRRVVDA